MKRKNLKKENILKTLNSVFDPNGLVPSELFNLRYLRREIYKKGNTLVAGEGFGNLSKIGVDFVDYGDHVQIYKKSKESQEIEFLFQGLFDLIVLLSDDIRDKSSVYFKSGNLFNDGNNGRNETVGRVLNNGKIDEFTVDKIVEFY